MIGEHGTCSLSCLGARGARPAARPGAAGGCRAWRGAPRAIAAPDVAVVTNVGPVHVELLGSVEAIAAAKAEIIDGLLPGGTAVVPADAGPLEQHLERAPKLIRFGPAGDVEATEVMAEAGET